MLASKPYLPPQTIALAARAGRRISAREAAWQLGFDLAQIAALLALTIRDYARYAQQPDVAYLWESAAAELANAARATPPGTAVYLDQRFVEGWPSVPFLLGDR